MLGVILDSDGSPGSFVVRFLLTLSTGGLVIFLAAIVSFVLTFMIVSRGRRSNSGSALLLIVPLPVLVSIFWMLKMMVASFSVLATFGQNVKATQWAQGISELLVMPYFGMLATIPSYLLAMSFLFLQSVKVDRNKQDSDVDLPQ